jgi:hypothetical protein
VELGAYQRFCWLVFVRAFNCHRVYFLSSGRFNDEQLNAIQAHPDVALVSEDGIASAQGTVLQYILVRLRRLIANNGPRTDACSGTGRLGQDKEDVARNTEMTSDFNTPHERHEKGEGNRAFRDAGGKKPET